MAIQFKHLMKMVKDKSHRLCINFPPQKDETRFLKDWSFFILDTCHVPSNGPEFTQFSSIRTHTSSLM